jgi:hypothetical protein
MLGYVALLIQLCKSYWKAQVINECIKFELALYDLRLSKAAKDYLFKDARTPKPTKVCPSYAKMPPSSRNWTIDRDFRSFLIGSVVLTGNSTFIH